MSLDVEDGPEAPPVADSVALAARRRKSSSVAPLGNQPVQDTATEQPEREAIADDVQLLRRCAALAATFCRAR